MFDPMSDLYTFTIEVWIDDDDASGHWDRVARWERFGDDEAAALASTIQAARREFPADRLRVRLVDESPELYAQSAAARREP